MLKQGESIYTRKGKYVEEDLRNRITDEMIENMVRKIATDIVERVARELVPDITERDYKRN